MTNVMITQFGEIPDGRMAGLFTITNASGAKLVLTDFGARMVALLVPDRDGKLDDVLLGFNSVSDYCGDGRYFGATIGRIANRVANGSFTLDGKAYTLFQNDGNNTLHGGNTGLDIRLFSAECGTDNVMFSYQSPAGEEGFPGEVMFGVNYSLSDDNIVRIEYYAEASEKTPVNLTNHAYFNLDGQTAKNVLDHTVTIHASRFTPVAKGLIPTGELRDVSNTPLDFSTPHTIGERINSNDEQMRLGGGYDHNYVLDDCKNSAAPHPAACVESDKTGRVLTVYTDMPGIQFYTGNFINELHGKNGAVYGRRAGFCLETQYFPNSVNTDGFEIAMLEPGKTYTSVTEYVFSTK